MKNYATSRREFLEFMGRSAVAASVLPWLSGCETPLKKAKAPLPFKPISPTAADQLSLIEGLRADVLLSWGDSLNTQGAKFGYNCDYNAFIPLTPQSQDEGLLWTNHESVDSIFVTGWSMGKPRTKDDVLKEMKEVGGSISHIKKVTAPDGTSRWQLVKNSRYNRRFDAQTRIPMIAPRAIEGSRVAVGTLANCAGGVTPWRTILTAEENYHNFFGDHLYSEGGTRIWRPGPAYNGWREVLPYPPEHYGWIVEIEPLTGRSKKLTALGRFSHECATTIVAKDGRCVVYSGDDQADECIYKFISKRPGSLEEGELFVADTVNGRWLSLAYEKHPEFKKRFKDQTELLVRTREAARIVGATLQDRPEDVEIDPQNGAVYVTLTNNKKKGNFFGSILKIEETGGDHTAMTFKASTFMAGGKDFAAPDNMVFDRKGNLWLCCDISDESLNKEPYTKFGNNGLYYIPMRGEHAGRVFQVAAAPVTAEFTGPCFSPDGRTLFLSVQHPGEGTTDVKAPLSSWPDGSGNIPRPSVVAISGPVLDRLVL